MATRPNRKSIETLLESWADCQGKITRLESKRDLELEPLRERYEKACAPILEASRAKIEALEEKVSRLRGEIESALKAGILPDGKVSVPQVAVDRAIAEVISSPGSREIAAEKFFAFVPSPKRDAAFWSCLKVLIGKAEKFLGADIDSLAKAKPVHKVDVRMK